MIVDSQVSRPSAKEHSPWRGERRVLREILANHDVLYDHVRERKAETLI